ncbi:hypothetical protein CC2G_013871 [Coprinopsis cinerea AmutBmut pab1-1]|nr:hypothetical protein CC2G_013871 [Coprinopsis cinerea AmutBmut pab1-1]
MVRACSFSLVQIAFWFILLRTNLPIPAQPLPHHLPPSKSLTTLPWYGWTFYLTYAAFCVVLLKNRFITKSKSTG